MYKSGSRTCLVVPSIKHCLYCSCAYVCHPQHNQSKLYIAPIFPFLISSPSILFISDDEEEKDVIIIEDSDGGYTHVYISSDEENDAVYGNDGASYANTKDVSTAAASFAAASFDDDDNSNGAPDTNNFDCGANYNGDNDTRG